MQNQKAPNTTGYGKKVEEEKPIMEMTATLTFPAPESCIGCPLLYYVSQDLAEEDVFCAATGKDSGSREEGYRDPSCPLVITERCVWHQDEDGIWRCSNCDCTWVCYEGTPKENSMNYCPQCGGEIASFSEVEE